jgi:ankyrin repeat protein
MRFELVNSRRFHLFLVFLMLTWRVATLSQDSYQYTIPLQPRSPSARGPEFTRQQALLIFAIRDHDLKVAEDLLSNGLNPNFLFRKDPRDAFITPLTESIAEGQAQISALLFQYGAEANFGGKGQICALCIAVWYSDANMVRELLKRGANVNARDNEGYTPLLTAAYQARDLTVTKLLITAGADAQATSSKSRNTVVMLGAQSLNLDAVKFFLDYGVDPCTKNSSGETAIDAANIKILKDDQKAELEAREAIIKLLESKCVPRVAIDPAKGT